MTDGTDTFFAALAAFLVGVLVVRLACEFLSGHAVDLANRIRDRNRRGDK